MAEVGEHGDKIRYRGHVRVRLSKSGHLLTNSEGEIKTLENELRQLTKDKSEASK
jgi:hypothetical protein